MKDYIVAKNKEQSILNDSSILYEESVPQKPNKYSKVLKLDLSNLIE